MTVYYFVGAIIQQQSLALLLQSVWVGSGRVASLRHATAMLGIASYRVDDDDDDDDDDGDDDVCLYNAMPWCRYVSTWCRMLCADWVRWSILRRM